MTDIDKCPICQSEFCKPPVVSSEGGLRDRIDCQVCGEYCISSSVLPQMSNDSANWTRVRRSGLAHSIRTQRLGWNEEARRPLITTYILEDFFSNSSLIPTVPEQARNIIRYVGNYQRTFGGHLERMPVDFYVLVGSESPQEAARVVLELSERGLITSIDTSAEEGEDLLDAGLTLDGWERWENELRKGEPGTRGIIAMKFGDTRLDKVVEDTIKPAVLSIPGLTVERVNDAPRAGIIDNIMRDMIRDAPFLIADLSHGNNGAYWEAGYAEGLGKPVIYICEKSRWKEEQTHFDTNHCTTLIWNPEDLEKFKSAIIATIRNSLKIY